VVDQRFAFGTDDKEQFRIYMRMMENFSGCRVLAYCLMCNHFHILLEVPPKRRQPLTDKQLLKRLSGLYSKVFVVEDGVASRTMAAYIDLNPVRAGMVSDPADYRWSSYGEAMGATETSGSKAKAGLVRAILADQGVPSPADARRWPGKVSKHYRMLLLEEGEEQLDAIINARGEH